MIDDWMSALQLRLTLEEFRRLPRNPAYKYEYLSGSAYLTPYPKHYHAVLPLPPPPVPDAPEAPAEVHIRPLDDTDLPELERMFVAAFGRTQPYASLTPEDRAEAARQGLRRTVSGEDGPWVRPASFVAVEESAGGLLGAALVTLLPAGDPCDWDSYYWQGPPPEDCVARRVGRPHLTWIFVAPLHCGQGTGTALLAAVTQALVGLGYRELVSTFLLGNEASMLWHWRNGFRLLPYPGSLRHISQRYRERQASPGHEDGSPPPADPG
jgi:GNAT superfamily N-acetyltransferase